MVYDIAKLTLLPVYRLWLKGASGLENVPEKDGFILAANHASYYDDVLLHSILIPRLDKKIHALVNGRFWRNPVIKQILDWGECIPVDIGKNSNNELALKKAVDYLKNKEIVLVFPEGTRSTDGRLRKAYTGVAKLALRAKAPVVPVGIIGSHKVLPKGKIFPRFERCAVKIGAPIYFEKDYDKKENNELLQAVATKVMKEIAGLMGQKYEH